jgi:hypothetical protein
MEALAILVAVLAFLAGLLVGTAARRHPPSGPLLPPPIDLPDSYEPASHRGGTLPWPFPYVRANRRRKFVGPQKGTTA